MRIPKYRLIQRYRLNEPFTLYIIERREWLPFPVWIYVDSSSDKDKAETLLAMLRTGVPYETRTTIA